MSLGGRLSHREASIAKAAALAGFDISNWQALLGLLSAVNDAHRSNKVFTIYDGGRGDFYEGAAYGKVHREWLRTIPYPDHYRPGSESRDSREKNHDGSEYSVRTPVIPEDVPNEPFRFQTVSQTTEPGSGNYTDYYAPRFHGRASTILSDAPEESSDLFGPSNSKSRHFRGAEGRLSPVPAGQAETATSCFIHKGRGQVLQQTLEVPIPRIAGPDLQPRARLRVLEDMQDNTPSPSPQNYREKRKARHGVAPKASASNTVPLDPRASLKRKMTDDDIEMDDDESSTHQNVHDVIIIEDSPSGFGQGARPGRRDRSLLADGVKRLRLEPGSSCAGKNVHHDSLQPQAVVSAEVNEEPQSTVTAASSTVIQAELQQVGTSATVKKLLKQTNQAKAMIFKQRDALGKRWEHDLALRSDATTAVLTMLNGHMTTVLDGLDGVREEAAKLLDQGGDLIEFQDEKV